MRPGDDSKHQPVRPTLVILLAVLVVPLTLLFGLALVFEDNAFLLPGTRAVGVAALFVVPVIFVFQIRRRGGWTAFAGGLVMSGAMLVVVVPVLLTVPGAIALFVAGAAILGALLLGRNLGQAHATPRQSTPPRPDQAW